MPHAGSSFNDIAFTMVGVFFINMTTYYLTQEADLQGMGKASDKEDEGEVLSEMFTPSRGEIKHRRSPLKLSSTSK